MIHLICPNPALDRTLLMEKFRPSQPNRPLKVQEYPGGKSFNVAYAINKIAAQKEIMVHTILGGKTGESVEKLAGERGISLAKTIVHANTRECNIIVDSETRQIYPIYEKGFELDKNILKKFTLSLLNSIEPNDIIVFSGSFMQGFPINYISEIKRKIENKHVKVFVDTSGEHLKNAFSCDPYMIKINDEEIRGVFPEIKLESKEDFIQFIRTTNKKMPSLLIITLGKDGVIAKMGKQIFYLKAPEIQVKNPIASGDFFLGVIIGCLENKQYEKALKKAISFSTANCLNWFPEVYMADVSIFYEHLKLYKWNLE